jgi:ABC-type Fe3+ transport system permease subunit
VTFTAALAWSCLRALLIALAVLPVCSAVARWLQGDDGVVRRSRFAIVAMPFLFPELLVGYAYAPWVAGRPLWGELACAGLMALRVVPVGVVAWLLTPPAAVTASALYCRRLRLRTWRDRVEWLRLWLAGPVWSAVPTLALVWLISFQQFELAALVQATSWSDWLFVQQVGGLSLEASLRAALLPAVGQLAVLSLGLVAVARSANDPHAMTASPVPSSGGLLLTAAYLLAAWTILIGWPTLSLVAGLPAGFQQLLTQPLRMQGLARELFAGLAAAVLAALVAWWLARVIADEAAGFHSRGQLRTDTSFQCHVVRWRSRLWWLLCLPGLLGSLVLGLALVALFQTPPLGVLYNTPLPWLLGLVLYLLPRGVLLRAWGEARRPQTAEYLADQLARSDDAAQRRHGRRLQWRLVEEPRFLAVAVLVVWGYLDLTTAYLLAPTGLTSGMVRLYNFMHFGRTAALSAEAFVLLAGPLVIAAAVWPLLRRGRA